MAPASSPEPQGDDASIVTTRPDRLRATRVEVDYRKLHRGPLAIQKHGTQAPSTVVGKPKEQPAPDLAVILQTLVSIQAALATMEEQARKAEERAMKMEERAIKMEERVIKMEERVIKMEERTINM